MLPDIAIKWLTRCCFVRFDLLLFAWWNEEVQFQLINLGIQCGMLGILRDDRYNAGDVILKKRVVKKGYSLGAFAQKM